MWNFIYENVSSDAVALRRFPIVLFDEVVIIFILFPHISPLCVFINVVL